jgi:hypothetical protein
VNEKNQMGGSNMAAILGRFYGGDAPTAEFSMDGARCSQVAEEEYKMPANSSEEICRLFQQYMREGDIDSVLTLYDPEAVFLNQSGEVKKGGEALRQELAPFAAMKAIFDFNIKQAAIPGLP